MSKLYTSPMTWFLLALTQILIFAATQQFIWLAGVSLAMYQLGRFEERGSVQCVDCGIDQVLREADEATDRPGER